MRSVEDMERLDRIFVEWDNGAYVSSLASDFGRELLELVAHYGRPSKVEFRAHDEGWAGPTPCKKCDLDLAECECEEPE